MIHPFSTVSGRHAARICRRVSALGVFLAMMIGIGFAFDARQALSDVPVVIPVEPEDPGASAVDLSAATGSLRFPAGNLLTARRPDLALSLEQDMTGVPVPTTNFAGDGALVALVRLPKVARYLQNPRPFGIMGTGDQYLQFRSPWMDGSPGTFRVRLAGRDAYSPAWDEDAALVVAKRSGSTLSVSWISLRDGTVHAGAGVGAGGSASFASNPQFSIGTIASGDPTLGGGFGGWPGEIALAGIVRGTLGDAEYARIALGENPVRVAADNGAVWNWLRIFDGTAAGLAAPSAPAGAEAGIADTTPPAVVWTPAAETAPASIQPGSDFLPRTDGSFIAVEHVVHPSASAPATVSDGVVIGLAQGAASAPVRFKGRVGGHAGNVEVRVVNRDDGAVVVDWTSLGAIAGGAFDGTVTVPRTASGWYVAQFRATSAPDAVFTHMDRWAVGYKIGWLGQSQISIALDSFPLAGQALDEQARDTATFLSNDDAGGAPGTAYTHMFPIDGRQLTIDRGESGSFIAFANQMRKFTGGTPVMIVDFAVSGTGVTQLINDDAAGRSWSVLQHKLDTHGADISVMVKQWGTSDMTNGAYGDLMDALVSGSGPQAGDHNLDAVLQPGYAFAVSPLTRHTGGDAYVGNAISLRQQEVAWANLRSVAVGPPVSDFQIDSGGGPHQIGSDTDPSSVRMAARMAVAAARALGLDTSQNPYFGGAAWGADPSEIVVSVVLPNGGTLTSPAPDAVRNFMVNGLTTGFTARVVGDTVVLTKDSGTWPPGSTVAYLSNGEDRAGGDAAAEAAIVAGMLYETWAPDAAGTGLPVMGARVGGVWVPDFAAVP